LVHAERFALEEDRSRVTGSDDARRRTYAELDGMLALLNERIGPARVVEPSTISPERRALRRYRDLPASQRQTARKLFHLHFGGVDEASMKEGPITYTSPLARALFLEWFALRPKPHPWNTAPSN
jgi:transcription elongation GreA/GreB family factor